MLARRRPESVADDRDAVLQACTECVHELEGSFDTSIEQIDAEAPLRNFYEVTALRSLAAGKCKLQNVVQRTAALSTTPVIPEALVREALTVQDQYLPSLAQARQQFEHDYLAKVLRLTSGSVAEAAHETVDTTGLTPEEVADRIAARFKELRGTRG